jgi:hypothetical protein
LRAVVARGGKIGKGEAATGIVELAHQRQSERITVETQGSIKVTNPDHRVEIFHGKNSG